MRRGKVWTDWVVFPGLRPWVEVEREADPHRSYALTSLGNHDFWGGPLSGAGPVQPDRRPAL